MSVDVSFNFYFICLYLSFTLCITHHNFVYVCVCMCLSASSTFYSSSRFQHLCINFIYLPSFSTNSLSVYVLFFWFTVLDSTIVSILIDFICDEELNLSGRKLVSCLLFTLSSLASKNVEIYRTQTNKNRGKKINQRKKNNRNCICMCRCTYCNESDILNFTQSTVILYIDLHMVCTTKRYEPLNLFTTDFPSWNSNPKILIFFFCKLQSHCRQNTNTIDLIVHEDYTRVVFVFMNTNFYSHYFMCTLKIWQAKCFSLLLLYLYLSSVCRFI